MNTNYENFCLQKATADFKQQQQQQSNSYSVFCDSDFFSFFISVQNKTVKMTSSKQKENKKTRSRKETKEAKALSKVIVRRLPPKLKETDFLEAVDPLPENDYFRYVLADESAGIHSFST